jgi:NTE family protein
MAHRINLIFQGGGVKGIAFAGVLSALEEVPAVKNMVSVDAVGGVSVGAITAALYAAGYTAKQLKDELDRKPVSSLLRESAPWTPAGTVWRLWRQKGIYSTAAIAEWVEELLARKNVRTFQDLKLPCRLLAANITEGRYEIYTERSTDRVAAAVMKSLSIPLFFTPYVDGAHLFVDGGLLSNYPLWLFAESKLPTVGVKLVGPSWHGATGTSSFFDYLKGLIGTMVDAHDKAGRGLPPSFVEIPIDTGLIGSTDFTLEDVHQSLLFERGKNAIAAYPWASLPAPRRVVFNDPNAAQILEETSNNLDKLFNRTETANKRTYERYDMSYFIEEGGWGQIKWRYILRNGGPGSISMLRYSVGYTSPQPISFKDLALKVTCGPAPFEAVALPLENTALDKAFAVAFIPPIAPGEAREVTLEYRSPDFEKFVNNEQDILEIEIDHEAGIGEASVTLEMPRTLGNIRIVDDRGATVGVVRQALNLRDSVGYVWRVQNLIPPAPLHIKIDFERS